MALGVWRKYSRGEAHGVEFFFMKQKTLFPAHFAPGRGANVFMKSTPSNTDLIQVLNRNGLDFDSDLILTLNARQFKSTKEYFTENVLSICLTKKD